MQHEFKTSWLTILLVPTKLTRHLPGPFSIVSHGVYSFRLFSGSINAVYPRARRHETAPINSRIAVNTHPGDLDHFWKQPLVNVSRALKHDTSMFGFTLELWWHFLLALSRNIITWAANVANVPLGHMLVGLKPPSSPPEKMDYLVQLGLLCAITPTTGFKGHICSDKNNPLIEGFSWRQ